MGSIFLVQLKLMKLVMLLLEIIKRKLMNVLRNAMQNELKNYLILIRLDLKRLRVEKDNIK